MKLVKRSAEAGEYVLVVNSSNDKVNDYQNGDILKIVKVEDNRIAYYRKEFLKYLFDEEYIVLEDFEGPENTIANITYLTYKYFKDNGVNEELAYELAYQTVKYMQKLNEPALGKDTDSTK